MDATQNKISKWCDDAMLSSPSFYTDEKGVIDLDWLKENYIIDQLPWLKTNEQREGLEWMIKEYVQEWWEKYPNAYKYR